MKSKIYIEDGAKVIIFFLLLIELNFDNSFYLILCTLSLLIMVYHLQQPYKSSVFTLLFVYHLLQIFAGVLFTTYAGKDINYKFIYLGTSTIVSLIGLILMFLPIIYYQNKMPALNLDVLKRHAARLSLNKTFYAYLISFVGAGFLAGIRFFYPGYSSTIVTLINIKWIFFLLFGFQSILKNKRRKEFYFFIALEILIGFTSFFSDFKTVIFYTIILNLTFITSLSTKRLASSLGYGAVLFGAVLFWSSVKSEYRSFLNKGSSTQSVQVSREEALKKLYELSNNQSSSYSSQVFVIFERLQATENFALTMNRIPAILPFENGKHWKESIEFVLTPRLLNPNKPVLDFSEKVTKYTGIQHAGKTQGTSFSLGYFVDSYIDFGIYGMMIPLLMIGLIFGYMHFYFVKNSSTNFIFNYSVAGALFMEFFALEMDNTYLLGRLFSALLIFYLLKRFFFPWLIKKLSETERIHSLDQHSHHHSLVYSGV